MSRLLDQAVGRGSPEGDDEREKGANELRKLSDRREDRIRGREGTCVALSGPTEEPVSRRLGDTGHLASPFRGERFRSWRQERKRAAPEDGQGLERKRPKELLDHDPIAIQRYGKVTKNLIA